MSTLQAPLLARYLAYQRDIGCDEVVLPEPWVKPNPVPVQTRPPAHEATLPMPTSLPQQASPLAATDLQDLARNLAESLTAPPMRPKTPPRVEGKQAEGSGGPGSSRPEKEDVRKEDVRKDEWRDFDSLAAWQQALEAEAGGLHPVAAGQKRGAWVWGTGAKQATLAVVALQPVAGMMWPIEPQARWGGQAEAGSEGELLAKMLKAMKIDLGDLYFTSLMKAAHPGRGWARKDTVKMLPWLGSELRLVQPQMVLALGEDMAQTLLRVGTGYEGLRQQSHRFAGLETVMTLGLGRLMAQEELKRDAWKDLQWLMQRLKEKGAIA